MKKSIDGNTIWLTYNNVADAEMEGNPVHFDWLESAVMKKQDGKWKMAFLHSTTAKLKGIAYNEIKSNKEVVEELIRVIDSGEFERFDYLLSDDFSYTQKGPYNGIAPTGKFETCQAIHIITVEQGMANEWTGIEDNLGLMLQLGMELRPKEK
jgi:hypothetical protein